MGGGVWLAGCVVAGLAIAQFRRAATEVQTHTSTAAIVETGVFAFSRNPIRHTLRSAALLRCSRTCALALHRQGPTGPSEGGE